MYRSWCPECVKARALTNPHFRNLRFEDSEADPRICLDYAYLGQNDETATPILVVKDTKSKTWWATAVQNKGANEFAVNFLVAAIQETGYRRLELKSDNEPALVLLKIEAAGRLEDTVVMRESPVGRSPSKW